MIDQKAKPLDYIVSIQNSIDYIEENLRSEITLWGCARAANFSTYHYYRVFEAFVGIPVMEYVRKRKLAHVLTDLIEGRRIIDIALDFGYSSERSFSRAFKQEYGTSPGRYRQSLDSGAIPVKLVLTAFKQNNINGGVVMEPKMVRKPAFKVAGFELKTTDHNGENNKTVPQFWDHYLQQNQRQKLLESIQPVSTAELGLCFPSNIETGDFSYVIGMEVPGFEGIPEGFFKGEVPAATYAVFTTPPADRRDGQFVNAIHGTWNYIFQHWFPKSGYEFDDNARVDFELYDNRAAGDYGIQIDIYVPVTRKVPRKDASR